MFSQDENITEQEEVSKVPCHFLVLRDLHNKPTLDQLTGFLKLQTKNNIYI